MPTTTACRVPMAVTAVVAALCLAAGCAPYVNIPPQRGDVARHDIDGSAVRAIVIPAVAAVVDQRPPEGPYVVELAAVEDNLTYPAVLPEIGPDAMAPFAEDRPEDAPVYEVAGVRIRGFSGEVDVVRPGDYGGRQLVTVYLDNRAFSGWSVERIRAWRGPVDASSTVPQPAP